MPLPARCSRTEKLRIDRALGRVFADETQDDSLDDSFLVAFSELLIGVRRLSTLLKPIRRPAEHDPVCALRQIARWHREFRRPVESWEPVGDSVIELVHSLVAHVFDTHPVPLFLVSVWFQDDAYDEPRRWFLAHARGKPFRRVGLPVDMTRRMERLFLATPDHLGIVAGMRRAEVLALGGSVALATCIADTRLGRELEHGEFWRSVLHFLVRHESEISLASIDAIVEGLHYLRHTPVEVHSQCGMRLEGSRVPELSLKGRNAGSLLRLIEEAYGSPENSWAASGLREFVFDRERLDAPAERWCVVELRDWSRLKAEGHALRHCVGQYASACRQRLSSIWSVRRQLRSGASRPVLTLEVEPRRRDIVQARGLYNALPGGRAREILYRWARREGLSVSLRYNEAH